MNRAGCFGLILGGLAGLLVAILVFVAARQAASTGLTPPATPVPADVSLFLSERSVSRFASTTRQSPTLVEFTPGGQMEITTRIELGPLNPVVDLGLSLEMQGTKLVSRFDWVKVGFLKIPAGWLPQEVTQLGAAPGEAMAQQVPPQFKLVGLTTTTEGIEFQLNWGRRSIE